MSDSKSPDPESNAPTPSDGDRVAVTPALPQARPREIGGRTDGLDPTRYGDWEKNGRCIDF